MDGQDLQAGACSAFIAAHDIRLEDAGGLELERLHGGSGPMRMGCRRVNRKVKLQVGSRLLEWAA